MRWIVLAVALSALLASLGTAQRPESMVGVRQLYLDAVEEASAIPRGLRAIEKVRRAGAAPSGSPEEVLLSAYEGAFITLRAKHGFWPPDRLRHLREGLGIMDDAVAARPDHPEIRYLRLLSCYFLPGILGRGDSVREDFEALAGLLPSAGVDFPPDLYAAMVRFVLDHGRLAAHQRTALEGALTPSGDG